MLVDVSDVDRVVVVQVKVGTQPKLNLCRRRRWQSIADLLQPLGVRCAIVAELLIRVRCRDKVGYAIVGSHLRHGYRRCEVRRAVVNAEDEVVMQVDHGYACVRVFAKD